MRCLKKFKLSYQSILDGIPGDSSCCAIAVELRGSNIERYSNAEGNEFCVDSSFINRMVFADNFQNFKIEPSDKAAEVIKEFDKLSHFKTLENYYEQEEKLEEKLKERKEFYEKWKDVEFKVFRAK